MVAVHNSVWKPLQIGYKSLRTCIAWAGVGRDRLQVESNPSGSWRLRPSMGRGCTGSKVETGCVTSDQTQPQYVAEIEPHIGVHGSHTPGWLGGCSPCMKLGTQWIAGLSSPNQISHVYAHFSSRVSPRNHAPFGSWFFGAHLSDPNLWLLSVFRSENRCKPDISP